MSSCISFVLVVGLLVHFPLNLKQFDSTLAMLQPVSSKKDTRALTKHGDVAFVASLVRRHLRTTSDPARLIVPDKPSRTTSQSQWLRSFSVFTAQAYLFPARIETSRYSSSMSTNDLGSIQTETSAPVAFDRYRFYGPTKQDKKRFDRLKVFVIQKDGLEHIFFLAPGAEFLGSSHE